MQDDEELSFLWRQEAGPDEYSEGPVYSNHRQHLEPLLRSYGDDEDGGDGLRADLWSAGGQYQGRLDPPLGANGQEVSDPLGTIYIQHVSPQLRQYKPCHSLLLP